MMQVQVPAPAAARRRARMKTTAVLVMSPRQTVKAAKKVRGGRKAIAEALL